MKGGETMARELTEREKVAALQREERNRIAFASVKDTLQLIDLTKNKSITYNTYSKSNLRNYLKNPATESNQRNLRKLSNYLYTVSHVYRRLIQFKALQVPLKSWTAYPDIPITESIDKDKILSNYEKVCNYVRNMAMETQILKCLLQAWKNDIVYGFCYGEPEQGEFFIHILDPDYCKISSQQYYSGVIGFAFDFSFFDGTNSFYLDVYDPIFKKMYNKYQNDGNLRWQELPIEKTFCIKVNLDNLDFPIPPLSGMFSSVIDLVDLQGIQNLKDEMEVYKLIYAKIDTISGAKNPDEFEIDLDLANAFYQKMVDALPENTTMFLSPMELGSIDFTSNTANDTNMIEDAYSNLIDANGGIVLNHNRITNSTAFKLALQFDTMDAVALVQQINAWINLWIKNHLGDTGIRVEYSDVSPFFIDDKIDKLLKVAQYGVPIKMELASLAGLNPVKERGMSYLEEALGLSTTTWNNPLVSSNVQSGATSNDAVKPTLDDSEISADGVDSRDKGNK